MYFSKTLAMSVVLCAKSSLVDILIETLRESGFVLTKP